MLLVKLLLLTPLALSDKFVEVILQLLDKDDLELYTPILNPHLNVSQFSRQLAVQLRVVVFLQHLLDDLLSQDKGVVFMSSVGPEVYKEFLEVFFGESVEDVVYLHSYLLEVG